MTDLTNETEKPSLGGSELNGGLGVVYILMVEPPTPTGAQFAALDEDLKIISLHFCTSKAWAKQDLISPSHEIHMAKYAARYPQGYRIVDKTDFILLPI